MSILEELLAQQQEKVLQVAQRISPGVMADDLWQPNDFPELENHPEFRYEEGVWHGILLVQTALRSRDPV